MNSFAGKPCFTLCFQLLWGMAACDLIPRYRCITVMVLSEKKTTWLSFIISSDMKSETIILWKFGRSRLVTWDRTLVLQKIWLGKLKHQPLWQCKVGSAVGVCAFYHEKDYVGTCRIHYLWIFINRDFIALNILYQLSKQNIVYYTIVGRNWIKFQNYGELDLKGEYALISVFWNIVSSWTFN